MTHKLVLAGTFLAGLCAALVVAIALAVATRPSTKPAPVTNVRDLAGPFVDAMLAQGYLIDGKLPDDRARGRARTGFSSVESPSGNIAWLLKPDHEKRHGVLLFDVKYSLGASELDTFANEWRQIQPWLDPVDYQAGEQAIAKAREQLLNGPKDQWGCTEGHASEEGKHFVLKADGWQRSDYSNASLTFYPKQPEVLSTQP